MAAATQELMPEQATYIPPAHRADWLMRIGVSIVTLVSILETDTLLLESEVNPIDT